MPEKSAPKPVKATAKAKSAKPAPAPKKKPSKTATAPPLPVAKKAKKKPVRKSKRPSAYVSPNKKFAALKRPDYEVVVEANPEDPGSVKKFGKDALLFLPGALVQVTRKQDELNEKLQEIAREKAVRSSQGSINVAEDACFADFQQREYKISFEMELYSQIARRGIEISPEQIGKLVVMTQAIKVPVRSDRIGIEIISDEGPDEHQLGKPRVGLGSKVVVDFDDGGRKTIQIVGFFSNNGNGKDYQESTYDSPLAQAIMGKTVGETSEFVNGLYDEFEVEIISID